MDDVTKTDGALLTEFLSGGREAAFEALVQRYGSLVFGVCTRALGQSADAEDAAQATFLTLAYKAASLQQRQSIAGWLHHVAWHVAQRAREARTTRAQHERGAAAMGSSQREPDADWERLQPLLDRELDALPEKYRLPLLLHHFQGLSQEQTAERMGCKVSTLSSQLTRGREILRKRLERFGVVLLLDPKLLAPELPQNVLTSTTQAAMLIAAGNSASCAGVSAQATELARGVIHKMFIRQVKIAAALSLALLLSLFGIGTAWHCAAGDSSPAATSVLQAPQPGPKPVAPKDEPAPAANDQFADWVKQLGVNDEAIRLAAEDNLRKAGEAARTALDKGATNEDPEIKNRAAKLLGVLKTKPVIDKMFAVAHELKSMETDMEMSVNTMGQAMSTTGHMLTSGDGARFVMNMDLDVAGQKIASRMVSDGVSMWTETALPTGQKTAQKLSWTVLDTIPGAGARKQNLINSVSDLKDRMDFTDIADGQLDGFDVYLIQGHLRLWLNEEARKLMVKSAGESVLDQMKAMEKARLQVDKQNLFVRKMEVLDANDKLLYSVHLTNLKLDVPLTEDQFKYTAPEGVTVTDMDAAMKAMLKKDEPEQPAATPPAPPETPKADGF